MSMKLFPVFYATNKGYRLSPTTAYIIECYSEERNQKALRGLYQLSYMGLLVCIDDCKFQEHIYNPGVFLDHVVITVLNKTHDAWLQPSAGSTRMMMQRAASILEDGYFHDRANATHAKQRMVRDVLEREKSNTRAVFG